MATIRRFEDLDVWKHSRNLARLIYEITNEGKFAKDFRLKDQIRRATISIMSNIAEGFERGGTQEFVNFLSYSKGSSGEVRAQLYIALDQGYVTQKEFDLLEAELCTISRLLTGFMKYLKTSKYRGTKYKSE